MKLQLLDGPGTYTKTTKVVVARDDHHKCQFFFPSELMFEKGHEVKLLGATIERLRKFVYFIQQKFNVFQHPVFSICTATAPIL